MKNKFFTREICVCVHLTQTRYAQKTCAEMRNKMDLKRNILDSVKECEIKLGYRKEAVSLYYPRNVLKELLFATDDNLQEKINGFCQSVTEELGEVRIMETQEAGRYQIVIPEKGVSYVHENVEASTFLKEFVENIYKPGMRKEDMIALFRRFSDKVVVEQVDEREWAVYFESPEIDAYVYYMEEDEFGLQYHRFTRESYRELVKSTFNG